jgi:hypothetical protein
MLFEMRRSQVPEGGSQNKISAVQSRRIEKQRDRIVRIATVVVTIGALLIPSVVAEGGVFMPACFVSGSIAYKRGQRGLGGTAIVVGVIAIFDLLFLACLF